MDGIPLNQLQLCYTSVTWETMEVHQFDCIEANTPNGGKYHATVLVC